jgi:hypothetical protein
MVGENDFDYVSSIRTDDVGNDSKYQNRRHSGTGGDTLPVRPTRRGSITETSSSILTDQGGIPRQTPTIDPSRFIKYFDDDTTSNGEESDVDDDQRWYSNTSQHITRSKNILSVVAKDFKMKRPTERSASSSSASTTAVPLKRSPSTTIRSGEASDVRGLRKSMSCPLNGFGIIQQQQQQQQHQQHKHKHSSSSSSSSSSLSKRRNSSFASLASLPTIDEFKRAQFKEDKHLYSPRSMLHKVSSSSSSRSRRRSPNHNSNKSASTSNSNARFDAVLSKPPNDFKIDLLSLTASSQRRKEGPSSASSTMDLVTGWDHDDRDGLKRSSPSSSSTKKDKINARRNRSFEDNQWLMKDVRSVMSDAKPPRIPSRSLSPTQSEWKQLLEIPRSSLNTKCLS